MKVGSFFILLAILALATDALALALALLLLTIALALARIPVPYLASRLRPFLPILAFTFLVNLLFTPGPPLFGWSPPWGGLSSAGLESGILRSLQAGLMLTLVILALSSSSPLELVEGFESIFDRIPYLRKPIRDAATPMVIAFRFLPVVMDEANQIRKAQKMRGVLLAKGLRSRVRSAFAVLAPVFLASLRRGEAMALALEARGFGIGSPPPERGRSLATRDVAALLAVCGTLFLTIGLRLSR